MGRVSSHSRLANRSSFCVSRLAGRSASARIPTVCASPLLLCDFSLEDLTAKHEIAFGLVKCPGFPASGCNGTEQYQRMDSGKAPEVLAGAMKLAREMIPGTVDTPTPSIWLANEPRTQHIDADTITVKIGRSYVEPWLRMQLAHEAVHVVLPYIPDDPVFHWTHEVIAHAFSVEFFRITDPSTWPEVEQLFDGLAEDATRSDATRYVNASLQKVDTAANGGRRYVMARQLGFDWALLSDLAIGDAGRPRGADVLEAAVASLPQRELYQ